jgi:hypothetical protein
MGKITAVSEIQRLDDPKTFMRFASKLLADIVSVVMGNLAFDENLRTQTVDVTFISANVDLQINHNLNKKTVRYFPTAKAAACDLYAGSSSNTNAILYLRSTVATTVTLVLY